MSKQMLVKNSESLSRRRLGLETLTVFSTMRVKNLSASNLKQKALVILTHLRIVIVSLMRHEVNIEVKNDEEEDKLEESKEEEIPMQQIAKVVEKNGRLHFLRELKYY